MKHWSCCRLSANVQLRLQSSTQQVLDSHTCMGRLSGKYSRGKSESGFPKWEREELCLSKFLQMYLYILLQPALWRLISKIGLLARCYLEVTVMVILVYVYASRGALKILTSVSLPTLSNGLVIKQVVCIYQELLSILVECEFYTSLLSCTLVGQLLIGLTANWRG